ncbi:MAG: endoribonuclease MazF [Bdellovibrionaceae bacterium]|nr:endoribonuclease MazF [Pseudobdellovibrionaceae bacterium]
MKYIPSKGDLIWLNFSPQVGHEQKGSRPALVISSKEYNKKTHLALCCPITSNKKDYPFEVVLNQKKIKGVILTDHLKTLDWKARKAKFIEKVKPVVLSKCIEKIMVLVSG